MALLGLATVLLLPALAGRAAAETRVVGFDDLATGTEVMGQYEEADGVYFQGSTQGDGLLPLIEAAAGQAHSGNQVASIAHCPSCEFFTPRSVGRLTRTASTVSAYVGWVVATPGAETAEVQLVARNAGGAELGASSATVTEGAPFSQQLSVSSAAADIASFELVVADPPNNSQNIGFDDLELTYPDAPAPPDFGLSVSGGPTNVAQGDFAEIPVGLNRVNGSDGDISLSVSGLPPGMSAPSRPIPPPGPRAARC